MTTDVEMHGTTVGAGNVMVVLNASANRDERKFEDPDTFDIHRDIKRHMSFGYSLHFCLGAHLARLEGRVALEEVLKRFPDWEVDTEHTVQARTSTVRGWETPPGLHAMSTPTPSRHPDRYDEHEHEHEHAEERSDHR